MPFRFFGPKRQFSQCLEVLLHHGDLRWIPSGQRRPGESRWPDDGSAKLGVTGYTLSTGTILNHVGH